MSAEARYRISAEDRSKAALDSFRKNIIGIDSAMGGLKTRIATVVSGVAIGAFIKSAADSADQVWNLHQRLGITTEALGELRHVAGLSGTQFDTVAKSVQKLSQNTGEALRGNVALGKVFKELHIDLRNFGALAPEQQFEVLADRLMAVDNEGKRVSYAIDLMGRSGAEMLQVMAEGSDGIREMREEAEALGLALDERSTKALADANDAIDRMKSAGTALGTTLASLAAGPIEDLSVGVIKVVGEFRGWIDDITSSTIDKAIEKMKEFGNSVEDINRLTAIRDLAENQKDLTAQTYDARSALEAVARSAGVFQGRVVAVGDVLTSGIHKVAQYGTSYNDLSAQMNKTTIIVDNDVVRAGKAATDQWDAHSRALAATAEQFRGVDIAIEPIWEGMRKLAAVGDPFDTANLGTAKSLLEQLEDAQRGVNLSFLKGEVGAEIWERLTGNLTGYMAGLQGYAGTLQMIIDLEAQRKALLDQSETGIEPPKGGPRGGDWSAGIPDLEVPPIGREPRGLGESGLERFDDKIPVPELLDELPDKLALASDGFMALAQNVDLLGSAIFSLDSLGTAAMDNFVAASVDALRGSKNAWKQFEQVMKQALASEIQSLAATAGIKALYETAAGLAALATGNPGAGAHFASAAKYGAVAGVGIVAAAALMGPIGSGGASSGDYDSGSYESPSGGRKTIGGSTTSTALASSPTTIHVTHLYYGNVYYGSQAQSDARSIQEQLDAGTLYVQEGVA